ncbi:MAG: T9SS type B sorting domain-containing protein, partial [Flavobacteriales bacterium]
DAWGADDGYIFDWTIHFDPELYPEPIVFTPVFGMECDSTSWTGPNILYETEDCNGITLMAVESGTYTYSATNNFGCTYETDVEVTVVEGPDVEIESPESFCGSPVSLFGNVLNEQGGFNYSYDWSPSDLVNGSGANVTVDGLTQDTVMTLTVSVTGGDLDNCEVMQMVEVDYIAPPTGFYEPFDLCPGDSVGLIALDFLPAGTSQDDYTYEWVYYYFDHPDSVEVVGHDFTFFALNDGAYSVDVSMVSPCSGTTTSNFDVDPDICELTIPNVISPNGDSMNEGFIVDGLNSDRYNGSTIRIFNRWGQLVYSSNDFGNSAGWRPDRDEAAEGTYYYILGIARGDIDLVINDINGPTIDEGEGYKYINGSFTLVR